jgi:hypothetical protein
MKYAPDHGLPLDDETRLTTTARVHKADPGQPSSRPGGQGIQERGIPHHEWRAQE